MASGASKSTIHGRLGAITGDQIRLITLHPGSPGDPLKCSITVASFTDAYEALSYTWATETADEGGDATGEEWEEVDETAERLNELSTDDAAIEVDGLHLDVTPNLFLALQNLRDSTNSRTLWIDSLCINLADIADRNAQVQRMDRIYRSASRVIIWLGLEGEHCDKAVGELLGFAANIHLSAIYPGSAEETRARIRPMVDMLDRPWFRRVWVVQEVSLAKEAVVQLGTRTVPWEWFLRAARVYRDHMSCCAAVLSPVNQMQEKNEFSALKNGLANILALDPEALRGLTLHNALRLCSGRVAMDPRDKVYALLGLLQEKTRLIEVDYALSAREVYESAALKIIEQTGDLSVLTDIDEYAGAVETASWATDWTADATFVSELYAQFRASGNLKADARLCSPHTLKISGLIFDNVTEVVDESSENSTLYEATKRLKAWEALVATDVEGPSPYSAGDERKNAFWQTVMMGMSADRSRRVSPEDHENYQKWRWWLRKYDAASNRNAFQEIAGRDPVVNEHNNMLAEYPETRSFFTTEDGYFGLGPLEMEPDDVVCILAGGKMPFILRALDESCDVCDNDQLCYRLIGFAYVHAIMDGETVRGIEADEEEGIEFCIR